MNHVYYYFSVFISSNCVLFFYSDFSCSFFFVFIIFCYCWFLINFSLEKRTVVVAHRRDSSLLSCLGNTEKKNTKWRKKWRIIMPLDRFCLRWETVDEIIFVPSALCSLICRVLTSYWSFFLVNPYSQWIDFFVSFPFRPVESWSSIILFFPYLVLIRRYIYIIRVPLCPSATTKQQLWMSLSSTYFILFY